jgi:hypothetical protein
MKCRNDKAKNLPELTKVIWSHNSHDTKKVPIFVWLEGYRLNRLAGDLDVVEDPMTDDGKRQLLAKLAKERAVTKLISN